MTTAEPSRRAQSSHPPSGLVRARRAATLLDDLVRIPGTDVRLGFDPVLSVVPVAGDLAGLGLGGYIVAEAWRAGVPRWTLARMCLNVGLDAVVGSVPVVGPVFDALVRANERNVELFERAVGASE